MKKLDLNRNSNEKTGRNSNTTILRRGSGSITPIPPSSTATLRRGSGLVTPIPPSSSTPTTSKYRKNSQPVVNLK